MFMRVTMQQFFFIDIVNEDQKVRLVSMHLYDKALEWHKQFVKIHGKNVYEKEIAARFSNVFEDHMVEIKNLKHDGEVKVYQEQFEVLLNRRELVEFYAVSLFISGLKSEISMSVRMFKPTTFKDTFCLARMQEATLALIKTKLVSQFVSQRSNNSSYASRYNSNVTPAISIILKTLLHLPSSSNNSTNKNVKSIFRKQLTQKELEEKRAKGLCFYCEQSHNESEHLQHLQQVLEVMRAHALYAKHSECTFLAPQVEYLGHVMSSQGVAIDPLQIQAMNSWPIPTTLKQLREVESFFNQLKQSMMTIPVLALPNFENEFVVETDASGCEIGVFLHQDGHPITYLIKALCSIHQSFSTYENEFLVVMIALDRGAFWGECYFAELEVYGLLERHEEMIIKKVGYIAYELELPASSQIHNVFHVSQLKKYTHSVAASGALPVCDTIGLIIKTSVAIYGEKIRKAQEFTSWSGDSVEDATWEIYVEDDMDLCDDIK
ncbi:putative mitochondrial protein [Tanacetum coccineum]